MRGRKNANPRFLIRSQLLLRVPSVTSAADKLAATVAPVWAHLPLSNDLDTVQGTDLLVLAAEAKTTRNADRSFAPANTKTAHAGGLRVSSFNSADGGI